MSLHHFTVSCLLLQELSADYGGAAGWQALLLQALQAVTRALQNQLLSIGLYQEGEVYLLAGNIMACKWVVQ